MNLTDLSKFTAGIPDSKTSEPSEHGFDINTNSLSVAELNWLLKELASNIEVLRTTFGSDLSDAMLGSKYVASSPSTVTTTLQNMEKSISDMQTKVNGISASSLTFTYGGTNQSLASAMTDLLSRVSALETFKHDADSKYARADGTTQFPHINIAGNIIEII